MTTDLPMLDRYLGALLALNAEINLTAARTPAAAQAVLVEPSLAIAGAWTAPAGPQVAVDIGSGNGFPGVVVAALWPACQVTLVERRAKKARAIASCLNEAGVRNAEAIACDARELKNERPALLGCADLVTVRAVGSLADTTRMAAPLLAPGGRVVHWKRPRLAEEEGPGGDELAASLGLRRVADVAHGEDGLLVVYERPGPAA